MWLYPGYLVKRRAWYIASGILNTFRENASNFSPLSLLLLLASPREKSRPYWVGRYLGESSTLLVLNVHFDPRHAEVCPWSAPLTAFMPKKETLSVFITFLAAVIKYLTRSNWKEKGIIWLTVWRDTVHHEGNCMGAGCSMVAEERV